MRPSSGDAMRAIEIGALAAGLALAGAAGPVRAADTSLWRWSGLTGPCLGDCAVAVYGGQFIDNSMKAAFGLKPFRAPWDYLWRDSQLVAGTFSRRFAEVPGWLAFEAEVGVGQRFGQLHATEGWGALYLRYTNFPWNSIVRTTIAVSTGLSMASTIDRVEREKAGGSGGSRLLHFLSPEVTFALPSHPEWELLARFHHRSGGREFLLGKNRLFNSTAGGAQYGVIGLRYRF